MHEKYGSIAYLAASCEISSLSDPPIMRILITIMIVTRFRDDYIPLSETHEPQLNIMVRGDI